MEDATASVTAGVDRLGSSYIGERPHHRSGEAAADQVNANSGGRCVPDGNGITDPHLVHGQYHRHYELLENIDGTLELGESPLDPVADIVALIARSRRSRGVADTRGVGGDAARVPQWLFIVRGRCDEEPLEGSALFASPPARRTPRA